MLVIFSAIQHNGIFGPWSGQIGKTLVGFKNKAVDVIRKYVIPANPRSVAQVLQRNKFRLCSKIAEKELINLIRPYWNFKSSKYSGFAAFVKNNIPRVFDGDDFPNIETTSGSYPGVPVLSSSAYDTVGGNLDVEFDNSIPVNGNTADKVIIVILVVDEWDTATKLFNLKSYFDISKTRGDALPGVSFTLETGLALSDIMIYVGVRNPLISSKIETGDSNFINPITA